MKKELDLLTNPFDGISNYERFIEECRKIARKLFNNYGIECNNKVVK